MDVLDLRQLRLTHIYLRRIFIGLRLKQARVRPHLLFDSKRNCNDFWTTFVKLVNVAFKEIPFNISQVVPSEQRVLSNLSDVF